MSADPWELLREVASDRNHTIECEREGYNPPFDGDDCLRCRVEAALAAQDRLVARICSCGQPMDALHYQLGVRLCGPCIAKAYR